jgi:ABC-type glutathione transport system ATPase component
VLIIEHDRDVVSAVADRIVTMESGKIAMSSSNRATMAAAMIQRPVREASVP